MSSVILHYVWVALQWGALAAYVIIIATLIVNVISENRNPLSTIGWVMALVLIPVAGAVLYFIFGRSLRNIRMISRRGRRRLLASEPHAPLPKLSRELSAENRQRVRMAYTVADSILYPDNTVELFNNGGELFEPFFADLAAAREYINLQFYIISGDPVGQRLRDILVERARAGVKVRVIYDYIGSWGDGSHAVFKSLKESGVEVHAFFRIKFPDKISRINWRNHRKVVVIDGRVGYIGGFNIARRYVDGGGTFALWRDLMARVTGPAVGGLQNNFAIDWNFMGHSLLEDPICPDNSAARPGAIPNVWAQLVASGPTSRWASTAFLFFKTISGARQRVWIQTPYFLPSDDLLKAVQTAALSGVDVRVMMPRRSDSSILTYASNSFIEECLLSGVKIYLYRPGMLHSKLLIVDDDFSTLGSTNFDYRSFDHNFEENIVMYSREVNERLSRLYRDDLKESTQIKLSQWNRRPRGRRILESLCRLLSPIL